MADGSIEQAISLRSSIVIDLGGGDHVLQEYGYDLRLAEFCTALGAHPLGAFMCGPQIDDFEHVLVIWRAGYFRPERSLLVLNEYLMTQGKTPQGAFAKIMDHPGFTEMTEGGITPIFFPRLPCMEEMRAAGLGYSEAAAGKTSATGQLLGPVRQFMVKQWLEKIRNEFARTGASEWLP